MNKYVKSLIIAILTFIAIILINFLLPRLLPGDPVFHLTGVSEEFISKELYDEYYHKLGLDLSLGEQFLMYLKSLFNGTLGYSYIYKENVSTLIFSRIGTTLKIVIPSILIVSIFSITFGLKDAFKEANGKKTFLSYFNVLFNSIPSFIIGMVLLILFSFTFKLFPSNGIESGETSIPSFFDQVWHLVLPILTFVLSMFPAKYFLVKENAKRIFKEKYFVFARISGLPKKKLALNYVFKNSYQTILTSIFLSLSFGISGSVIIENIFSINGMGLLFNNALTKQDFPLLQGILFFTCSISILMIILCDLFILIFDPKARRLKNAS